MVLTNKCSMKNFTLLIMTGLLVSCAQLPEINPNTGLPAAGIGVSNWILPNLKQPEPARLLVCDVEMPGEACKEGSTGLKAVGIGGFLLPLKVSLPTVTINSNQAALHVTINSIGAGCTKGKVKMSQSPALLEISNVFCNWLVIGNVISNLKLSIDWEDPQNRSFGGRYAIKFNGTGNGSGSGFYSAEVES